MKSAARMAGNLELDLARVLLVDDDPASRLTLQTVLQAGGYHVDSAARGAVQWPSEYSRAAAWRWCPDADGCHSPGV